ncbi:MAG: hypothetical protein II661_08270, partial [Bacteroidales bacterium]|nr:hypothetical protein [Bacteroidales bacterium]
MKHSIITAVLFLLATTGLSAQNTWVQVKMSGFPTQATQAHIGYISGSQMLMADTVTFEPNSSIRIDI